MSNEVFRTGTYIVQDASLVTIGEVTVQHGVKMPCFKLRDNTIIVMSQEDKKEWERWQEHK